MLVDMIGMQGELSHTSHDILQDALRMKFEVAYATKLPREHCVHRNKSERAAQSESKLHSDTAAKFRVSMVARRWENGILYLQLTQ